MKNNAIIFTLLLLSGCVTLPLAESNSKQTLNWCPPLPNCASTESATFVHSIQPFELAMPVQQAWPIIRASIEELPRMAIKREYPGYIYAKSYSAVFKFLDYFEVLAVPEEQRLMVRSSSLLGISDLGVNARRTQEFRQNLKGKGVIK